VCDDTAVEVQGVSVPSWIVIRYQDSLNASSFLEGQETRLIQDIKIEDLISIVEETERLVV
jgi:hypothetical protein